MYATADNATVTTAATAKSAATALPGVEETEETEEYMVPRRGSEHTYEYGELGQAVYATADNAAVTTAATAKSAATALPGVRTDTFDGARDNVTGANDVTADDYLDLGDADEGDLAV